MTHCGMQRPSDRDEQMGRRRVTAVEQLHIRAIVAVLSNCVALCAIWRVRWFSALQAKARPIAALAILGSFHWFSCHLGIGLATYHCGAPTCFVVCLCLCLCLCFSALRPVIVCLYFYKPQVAMLRSTGLGRTAVILNISFPGPLSFVFLLY